MPIPTIKENVESSDILFLTFKIINSLPIFVSDNYFNIMLESFDWHRRNAKFKILAYTILINHIHLVVEFLDYKRAEEIIKNFKKFTAHKIIEQLKNDKEYNILDEMRQLANNVKGQELKVWRRSNWPESINSEKFFNQKVDYTDYNAELHGVVKDIENYPYTSYHNHYCNHPVLLEIDEIAD